MKTNFCLLFLILSQFLLFTRADARDRGKFRTRVAVQVVKGKITNENSAPLVGVSVQIKNTSIGTTTNEQGEFTITIPNANSNLVLLFQHVGYVTQEIIVGNRETIDVQLVPNHKVLTDVVVVGYGTTKKSDLTGSISSVKSSEINAFPITNPVQGLQGRAAGVQVMQNSGQPGGNISVRIRGGNSLRGNNEPLYVVDGFPLSGNPSTLIPNDIESIEVLKDASATAIYGSRGANGVVIITMKKGKAGVTRVDLDSYYGFQNVVKKLDLLNAREFAEIANERAANDGLRPYFTQDEVNSFGEGTNWQDELFRTAPIQNHSLTFSGGTNKIQYSVSGNYLDQKGIILGSGYSKGTVRANLTTKVSDKFSFDFSSILSRSNQNRLNSDNSSRGGGVLSSVFVSPPTIAPLDANGNYSDVVPYAFSPNNLSNALSLAKERKENNLTDYILANTSLTYEIIPGLSLRISGGIENFNRQNDFYSTSRIRTSPTGSASISTFRQTNILNENILTYNRTVNNDHNYTVTAGVTYQSEISRSFGASAEGFVTDALENNALQSATNPGIPSTNFSSYTLLSSLGRINYSFKNKYLVTSSIRTDGSSRFGRNNKWGYFPSVAFAWRVIEEDFLENASWLSDLKFRASWGKTGSTAISPYQTLNTLGSLPTIFNNDIATGFAPGTSLANPNLKWETTAQNNIGVDIGLFSQRLTLSADYYVKNTTDLLALVTLPPATGYTNTTQNIGHIRNSGVELGLSGVILNRVVKWDVNTNVSFNKSKAIKLAGGNDVFGAGLGIPIGVSVNLVREGLPVGVFFGYKEDGLNEKGEIKFKDIDGDGALTTDDRTVIGNPNPDMIYGFNSTTSYKSFELTLFLQGVKGADIFNYNSSALANSFAFGENQIRDIYDNHWSAQKPNANAKYPKISGNTKFRESDRYIEDGSYLRLKNLQLAYDLRASNLGLNWIRSLRVYSSVQNLFTFTKYSWYDPEVNTFGGEASISMGIDKTAYPIARTLTFGVRIGL